jgi:hypothetical protein
MDINRIALEEPFLQNSKTESFGAVEVRFPLFEASTLPDIIRDARERAAELFSRVPRTEVDEAMARVDDFFGNPARPEVRDIIDLLHRTDGFSRHDIELFGLGIFPPIVRYDRTLIGRFVSRAFETRRPVETAFGYLQRFGTNSIFRRWREPGVLSHFVSGNVVGYSSILTRIGFPVRRAGAAQIIKLPSSSAVFPMIYLNKLAEISPPIRSTMVCGYWKGGDRGIEDPILKRSDAVNILGSDETISSVRERLKSLGRRAIVLPHGHKVGFAFISREFSENPELCEQALEGLACDISAFDGAACYCPKNIFVQGDHRAFAEHLFDRLARLAGDLSPVSPAAKATGLELRRVLMGLPNVLSMPGGEAFVRVGEKAEFWFPDETHRYVQVMPVGDEIETASIVKSARSHLQTAVTAVPDGKILPLLGLFGKAGVSNIHFPGSAPLLNVYEEPHDWDFDFIKIRSPYRVRFAATNFKKNADWLGAKK